jgi:hypothetical protein
MCRLSWNMGTSTSWNRMGLSRPVMGLFYLYLYLQDPVTLSRGRRHDIYRVCTFNVIQNNCMLICICHNTTLSFVLEFCSRSRKQSISTTVANEASRVNKLWFRCFEIVSAKWQEKVVTRFSFAFHRPRALFPLWRSNDFYGSSHGFWQAWPMLGSSKGETCWQLTFKLFTLMNEIHCQWCSVVK